MANKGKKPVRQTNTANQVKRMPNYNNSNMGSNKNVNQRQNYNYNNMNDNMNYNNNINYNNLKYNYSPNVSEMSKKKNIYGSAKSNLNRKPITANLYNRNHTYNQNNINENMFNNQNRNYNANQYNLNNNNYNNNFNNNYNNNYNNIYKNNNIRRNNNNFNYNNFQENDNDERPIGGGLTAEQMPEESAPTSPCPHCGRSFNSQALNKHIKICEKVFLKKRKAFNTQKQRIQDSEQASLMKQGALEEKRNPLLNNKKTGGIPKWKLQSMAFRAICNPRKNPAPNQLMNNNKINMIGKNVNKGMNKNMNNINMGNNGYGMGGGLVSNAMAYDYKHCEFCNRNYNEEAYNKHLNFCKRRYENEKLKNKSKKSNNNGMKNQYGSSLSGGVKYNNGKYNKKKQF